MTPRITGGVVAEDTGRPIAGVSVCVAGTELETPPNPASQLTGLRPAAEQHDVGWPNDGHENVEAEGHDSQNRKMNRERST